MNWPYLHLLINHAPIILTVLGTAAALLALATKKRVIWLYAVATLSLSGMSVYPVYLTGDQAQEIVDKQPGVDRSTIHAHDEAATYMLWSVLLTGVIAAYGWWRLTRVLRGDPFPTWLQALTALAALLSTATAVRTGWFGGQIIHGKNHLSAPVLTPEKN